jgi:hypothetical protein
MARRVFFSFDYNHVWKVNQIRNMPEVIGTATAGFQDASLWEEAKKKTSRTIQAMIDQALLNTSVTVVFVTRGAAGRDWIKYEIDKSLSKGNGLLAVQIHHLKDAKGQIGGVGAIPAQIEANRYKAYKYTNRAALGRWIENAAKRAGR